VAVNDAVAHGLDQLFVFGLACVLDLFGRRLFFLGQFCVVSLVDVRRERERERKWTASYFCDNSLLRSIWGEKKKKKENKRKM
jgi:hypothetical protein